MKKKTIFISDCHMGAGKKWDWFSDEEGYKLIEFFEYITKRALTKGDVKEVVLLGDIFDLWVCPHNVVPHTFLNICEYHKEVFDAIKEMASKIKVIYINGNHDYQVTSEDIKIAFDGKVKHFGQRYQRGNILAIHGHQYALFNKPDPKNGGPILQIPLGYYITRLHTTLGKSRQARANLIAQVIDESLQVLGPEKLPESVLDVLRDSVIQTTGSYPVQFLMGKICRSQSYAEVKNRYRDLFDDWIDAVGLWKSIQMLMCEMDRLGSTADQLCKDGIEIVVMGHSHGTKMDKDHPIGRNRIYANCGFWCGMDEKDEAKSNAHFVQTDGETVELCHFCQGWGLVEKSLML